MKFRCKILAQTLAGSLVGAFAGLLVSLQAISTLTFVSLNQFANIYVTALFTVVGSLLLLRFIRKNKVGKDTDRPRQKTIGEDILHIRLDLRPSLLLSERLNVQIE